MASGVARRPRSLSAPPPEVLAAFGVASSTPLAGGQGDSHRAGDLVLKPVLDVVEATWLAGVLDALPERDDLRVIRPARAVGGDWVVGGWAAWHWLDGERRTLPTAELLDVSRRVHELLRHVPWSPALATEHAWARGHAWAWGTTELDVPSTYASIVDDLRVVAATGVALDEPQLVHGDLAGNVLVAEGLATAVIDISLDWQPPSYADAIAVVDNVAWWDAPLDDLDLVATDLAARAVLFRLGATAILCADDEPRLARELSAFEPIAERLPRPAR